MAVIRFGTEGWRAVIADQFTFHNVRAVARATGRWFQKQGTKQPVVVGHDTRFLGPRFAQVTADEIAACDLPVHLSSGWLPTPALDYYIVKHGYAGGAMLTASHNLAEYNGFKVKRAQGCSVFDDEAKWIEEEANEILGAKTPLQWAPRRDHTRFEVREDYISNLLGQVDVEAIRKAKLTVVADMMHGAGGGFFDLALERAGCNVRALRANPDPTFEGKHPEPLGHNLEESVALTAEPAVDLGVATDGDADRFGMMAEGEFVDVQRTIVYLLYHLLKNRGWKGTVVRSINVTSMLDRLCEHFGVKVIETSVGFKSIAREMIATDDILLAVEESGGFGIRGHIPDRDGTLTALTACEARAVEGKPVSDTLSEIFRLVGGPRSYDRLDLKLTSAQQQLVAEKLGAAAPDSLAGGAVAEINRLDGAKYLRDDGAWVMLRLSGTEPLIRIYAEGISPEEVRGLLDSGADLVKRLGG